MEDSKSVVLQTLLDRPIAHRGLHDGNRSVPENSSLAAECAIEAGYGIECDIRLSRDGKPHVFHDHDLARLCGVPGRVRDCTSRDLAELRLVETGESIPTLASFLVMVAGRVPLLIEMKEEVGIDRRHYVDAVLADLERYDGPAALMSFDRALVAALLDAGPAWPVGITTSGSGAHDLQGLQELFDRGCSFVSHDSKDLPNEFCTAMRTRGRVALLCWTVRGKDDQERLRRHVDQITFEGFRPA